MSSRTRGEVMRGLGKERMRCEKCVQVRWDEEAEGGGSRQPSSSGRGARFLDPSATNTNDVVSPNSRDPRFSQTQCGDLTRKVINEMRG